MKHVPDSKLCASYLSTPKKEMDVIVTEERLRAG